jgi:hypothetical protein
MRKIIEHLEALGNSEVLPADVTEGLCDEIKNKFGPGVMTTVKGKFKTWKHHSGDKLFPVPDPDEIVTSKIIYVNRKNQWTGKYGDMRKNLCLHVAQQLLEDLNV